MRHGRATALPGPEPTERRDWQTLRELLPYLWAYKLRVVFALACLLAEGQEKRGSEAQLRQAQLLLPDGAAPPLMLVLRLAEAAVALCQAQEAQALDACAACSGGQNIPVNSSPKPIHANALTINTVLEKRRSSAMHIIAMPIAYNTCMVMRPEKREMIVGSSNAINAPRSSISLSICQLSMPRDTFRSTLIARAVPARKTKTGAHR